MINKGSYRISKGAFSKLLFSWQLKYKVEVDYQQRQTLVVIQTNEGELKAQFKYNGWLTIT